MLSTNQLADCMPFRVDQVTTNHFESAGSSIAVHQDSKELFDRPIISLRLLSESILSFGCTGFGMRPSREYTPIPLKRGVVTCMEGYAADTYTHCIRPSDTVSESMSIIFGRVHKRTGIDINAHI